MKKIVRKLTIKLDIKIDAYRALIVQIKDNLNVWIKLDGDLKSCFRKNCVTDCPRTVPRDTYVSRPRDKAVVTGRDRIPTEIVAMDLTGDSGQAVRMPTPKPQDCESLCAGKGMSTQGPDLNAIARQLPACVKPTGPVVSVKRLTSGSCTCYKTKVDTSGLKPFNCPPGKCGKEIPCKGKVECQQGNTHITESCTWKGWKVKGQALVPVVGGK